MAKKNNNNNFARAAHFFVHFLAFVFHDYNVFLFTFFYFSLPLIFTLVATSIAHFLTAAIKFSCFSTNEIGLRCFLFLALALSLLSGHVNVDNKI